MKSIEEQKIIFFLLFLLILMHICATFPCEKADENRFVKNIPPKKKKNVVHFSVHLEFQTWN
jgi:hypothetical protein